MQEAASQSSALLPVDGFVFARSVLDQKGDEAVTLLLEAAGKDETDWFEKKAAVYRTEKADPDYRAKLEKMRSSKSPPETIAKKEEELQCELLAEIAWAIVAMHNSRGGVILVGIDDRNGVVPLADNDPDGILVKKGVGGYALDFVLGRLRREEFCLKDGKLKLRLPVAETGVFPVRSRYEGTEIIALLVPALERGKEPLLATRTTDNSPWQTAPQRGAGDVGLVKKGRYDDRWIRTAAQLSDFHHSRDQRFLDRTDLAVRFLELGLSCSWAGMAAEPVLLAKEPFSSVSQPRTKNFVGRERELEELHGLLADGRIPVVTGPGGTGKTELVLQYAARHKADYPGGMFQMNMETAKNWDDAFRLLLSSRGQSDVEAYKFLVQDGFSNTEDADKVVSVLRRRTETSGRILLVLDNVESVRNFFWQPVFNKLLLPSSICLVATARNSNLIFGGTDRANELRLNNLTAAESLDLLLYDKPAETDVEREAASNVAQLLDGNPLYLRAIPALLDDPYSPLAGSYALLEQALRESLREIVNTALEAYGETEKTPTALWKLIQAYLSRYAAGSAWIRLAHMASFFSADGFREAVLRHLWRTLAAADIQSDAAFRQALGILQRHGVLVSSGTRLCMHRLTADAIRRSARENEVRLEESMGKVLAQYDGMGPDDWLTLADSVDILAFIPSDTLFSSTQFHSFSLQTHLAIRNPSFLPFCQSEKFTGDDWVGLLNGNPKFSDHCPWDKLDGRNWADLLGEKPQFSDRCPWEMLTGEAWAELLGKQPQFAVRCPWEKLNGASWAMLLRYQPQFSCHCSWGKLDGLSWAWLLEEQPQFANRCTWEKLDGRDWARLLSKQPQFAVHCLWNKLTGTDWGRLLGGDLPTKGGVFLYPPRLQFADHCPWEKLGGGIWASLLSSQPQLADRCQWENLDGRNWAELLGTRPQFADHCPWELLDGHSWANLLKKNTQFEDRCPWDKFEGRDWAYLLASQPQFANHCQFEKMNGRDWMLLLSHQPQFADRCPWEKFDGFAWAKLLMSQPKFADRCQWGKLSGGDWGSLLEERPQFANRCPWDKLDSEAWASLLGNQPQFADHCPWEQLDGQGWAVLLGKNAQFADRCPWEKLDGEAWASLLGDQPQFFDRCPLEKFDGFAWALLLRAQPQFADCCQFEKMDGNDWAYLLGTQPQFADKCPWSKFDGGAWSLLLSRQPQFAAKCPWEMLFGTNWAMLLCEQPQFAGMCPWDKLNDSDWAMLISSQPQFADYCPWEKLSSVDL